jgi:16S rRNA (adenine1518-N6/adenine1519-N6)-dimethyltransferase
MTQTPASIRHMLRVHGVAARKRLGQHFLADPNIIAKMVATAGVSEGDRVVEVGAGTGALTSALADTGALVVAYEIDQGMKPILDDVLGGRENVEVRFEDASVALPGGLGSGKWRMVSNLPYNVGTRIVLSLLRGAPQVTDLTVMIQQEVADRLVARPGSPSYGLPSIVVALTGRARRAFTVPPQVFVPPPKVSSAVVVVERHEAPEHVGEVIDLAAELFQQRRKMLRSRIDPAILDRVGIEPNARPEDVDPQKYIDMWEAMHG